MLADSYRDLAALLGSDGLAEEAAKAHRKELDALEKLDTKDVTTLHRRAAAYKGFHQYDKALADCSKTIELNSKDQYAWYQRASLNNQIGRLPRPWRIIRNFWRWLRTTA
jgi:tetratricopeptide (TPR) repeat protein